MPALLYHEQRSRNDPDRRETDPGVTVQDEDGNYNMYINARLTFEERKRTVNHELNHIDKDHFHDERPIAEIEEEADKKED